MILYVTIRSSNTMILKTEIDHFLSTTKSAWHKLRTHMILSKRPSPNTCLPFIPCWNGITWMIRSLKPTPISVDSECFHKESSKTTSCAFNWGLSFVLQLIVKEGRHNVGGREWDSSGNSNRNWWVKIRGFFYSEPCLLNRCSNQKRSVSSWTPY